MTFDCGCFNDSKRRNLGREREKSVHVRIDAVRSIQGILINDDVIAKLNEHY